MTDAGAPSRWPTRILAVLSPVLLGLPAGALMRLSWSDATGEPFLAGPTVQAAALGLFSFGVIPMVLGLATMLLLSLRRSQPRPARAHARWTGIWALGLAGILQFTPPPA